jgi:uncharacterized LabA/DUF88 family protein
MAQETFPYTWPSNDQTYLFIDGGYVQKRYTDAVRAWFGDGGEIDFPTLIRSCPAGRSFYYDCLDEERRAGEAEADHLARIEKQKVRLNKVREAHGCHIRLGVLKGRNRRQKKVDIMLAVDMLTHAANKNMTKALLLAGDLDFQPAVESLVQLGIFVELIADDKHTASDLAWSASSYRKLTFRDYYSWSTSALKEKYPLPRSGEGSRLILKDATVMKTGSLDGEAFTVYQSERKFYLCPQNAGDGNETYYRLSHDDVARLELYLELQGYKVVWD